MDEMNAFMKKHGMSKNLVLEKIDPVHTAGSYAFWWWLVVGIGNMALGGALAFGFSGNKK
jgi:hypothetical protein